MAGSIAHADPASELPALLLCLDGAVIARSAGGEREIAAADFFQGPLMTAARADELVTHTRWSVPAAGAGWGFHEVARRHGDFALVGVAALVTVSAGVVHHVRVTLFGAGATPVRARHAEAALSGQRLSADVIAEAATRAAAEIEPDSDLHATAAYRRRAGRTLVTRALTDAADARAAMTPRTIRVPVNATLRGTVTAAHPGRFPARQPRPHRNSRGLRAWRVRRLHRAP